MSDRSRRRPWLAAVLALVVSGLGHAYLRRWARAFGWYVAVTATVVVLVPDAAVDQLFAGKLPPIDEIAPVLLVVAASVIDAYVVALRNNRAYERARDDERRAASERQTGDDWQATDDWQGAKRRAAASAENESGTAAPDDGSPASETAGGTVSCPDCGRDVDTELEFCQWCATPLDE